MELQQIKAFIDAMASSDLTELEASKDGWTLRLVRRAAPNRAAKESTPSRGELQAPAASTTAEDAGTAVRAPLSGILYLNPSPDAASFVVAGQAVKAGDTLCIIEAMKVFNTIRAERDGIIEAVMASSGDEVDAGELLMRFAPR
ncbi:acetyl-CoA carboxylase biotin carboxyl carrier protein subunit [Bradyrhizobium prioriisuperbiae]|uniref:acetyl-CoA carboxylase biotin carboxyl carrier protein n=1 Tax=Bradyrhizobium prioriisuperbiae TaxID=2854389 RepID=UPI0028E417CA|nr:acetyl-CoA carboxylase biotin carboxyl carrier protein subunit [Bradyrhizobium prioritasuperba]